MNARSIGSIPIRLLAFVSIAIFVAACAAPAATPTAAPTAAAKSAPAPANTAVPVATVPAAASTTAPAATSTTVPVAPTPAPVATKAPTVAAAAPLVNVANDAKLGPILVDNDGMVLYLYTKDEPNVSNCYDQCATNWPPLTVKDAQSLQPGPGVTGKLATTTRKDGSNQVTYNGMPLYYWIKDAKPGETTGQNVGSVWFVIPPSETGFPTVKVTKDQKLGNIITDLKGMTVYKYTKDEPSISNCYDQCATNWPPLIVKDGDPTVYGGFPGKLGTTTRKDGSKQVTLDGVPLYYWAKDTKPGETTGQGVGSVWYVIEAK